MNKTISLAMEDINYLDEQTFFDTFKHKIMESIKKVDKVDFYNVFDICRERHNERMTRDH